VQLLFIESGWLVEATMCGVLLAPFDERNSLLG